MGGRVEDVIAAAARDLLAMQNDDGGWAQLRDDGERCLCDRRSAGGVARERRGRAADRAYRKGLEFLLRTQIDDGSWMVETRSVPIQAYFESGFPYGVNQWISAAATGWATTALALASEPAARRFRVRRRRRRDRRRPKTAAPRPTATRRSRSGSARRARRTRRRPRPIDVETVAEGLSGAFCFDFLPDGRMIVGERPGRIKIVGEGRQASRSRSTGCRPICGPRARACSRCGPDRAFATNRPLYLTYTVLPDGANQAALPRSPGVLMVASATLSADDARLENLKVLLNAEGTGGRLIQAPDGTLLITSTIPSGVGINAADWPQPQQLDSDMGKVLRINADGSIPKDNPFVGRAGAHPEIYALGSAMCRAWRFIRAPACCGLSEHGPRGGDEINAVEKGKNYGFPVIGYGRDYTGKPINGDKTAQDGMEQPVYFWTPDIAPAGIAFYTGKLFPAWQGDLFVSALAGKSLVRLVLKDDRVDRRGAAADRAQRAHPRRQQGRTARCTS